MIFHSSSSRWQTVIADLSLILFLVAASALEEDNSAAGGGDPGISLTIWSDVAGAMPLPHWLSEQAPDDGQRLAITVTYRPGQLDNALSTASRIGTQAGLTAADARIVIMEGQADSVEVRIVQDDADPALGPKIAY